MEKRKNGEPFHQVPESIFCLFFLLAKLKEKQFEKLSVIQEPEANSG